MLLFLACTNGPDGPATDTSLEDSAPLPDPYACGWNRGDPGDLVSTGSGIGDVVADLKGVDQCGEEYHLWDGYGTHTVLLAPVFW